MQKYLKDDRVIRLVANPEMKEGAAPQKEPAASKEESGKPEKKVKGAAGEEDQPKKPDEEKKQNEPRKGKSKTGQVIEK